MSEEQVQEAENTEDTKAEEVSEETEQKANGHDGTDFVEIDDPKLEARFKRLYAHVKDGERRAKKAEQMVDQLVKDNKALIDRFDGMDQKQVQQETDSRISELKSARREALENQDFDRVTDIDDEIINLRVQATKEEKKEPEKESPKESSSEDDISDILPPEDQMRLAEWASEKEDGEFKRPWAQPGNPLQQKAASIGYAVLQDPEIVGKGIDAILEEVDKLMTGAVSKPSRNAPSVLNADKNIRHAPRKEAALSEDEKAVAAVMFPKLSPEDANKKYAGAVKKFRSAT